MWTNLSSYISRVPARAAPPSPNGAVITPLYNLTHRLSRPENRGCIQGGESGWVGGAGKGDDGGGRVALRVSFLKAGAELSAPPHPLFFCVCVRAHGHFCAGYIVCSCYTSRGIQAARNGKFYFLHKEFQITAEIRVWGEIVNNSILSSNKSGENEPRSRVAVKICWLRDIKWEDGFAQGNCFEFFHRQRAAELSFLKPSPPRSGFFFFFCRVSVLWWVTFRKKSAELHSLKTGNVRIISVRERFNKVDLRIIEQS